MVEEKSLAEIWRQTYKDIQSLELRLTDAAGLRMGLECLLGPGGRNPSRPN